MRIEVLKCPNCGAPIPPGAGRAHVCEYCKHVLTGVAPGARVLADDWRGRPEDAGRPRVVVGGERYVVLGRLGVGDGCDVFLARRDARLTEMVTLKVVRALTDADLLAREWAALAALHASDAPGADHFTRLLPQPVAHGPLRAADGAARPASVFRWRSGFVHTLDDVARAHRGGLDPRVAVWIWKRTLELLGWVHAAGYAHGAVLPAHLLVHPRDHGVVLVGWSCAAPAGAPLAARGARGAAHYPPGVAPGAPVVPAVDVAMSARCVARLLGGEPANARLPASVPAPFARLVLEWLEPRPGASAWRVKAQLDRAAREAFGPSRYVPLEMPE